MAASWFVKSKRASKASASLTHRAMSGGKTLSPLARRVHRWRETVAGEASTKGFATIGSLAPEIDHPLISALEY
jgi:hypothetical protein